MKDDDLDALLQLAEEADHGVHTKPETCGNDDPLLNLVDAFCSNDSSAAARPGSTAATAAAVHVPTADAPKAQLCSTRAFTSATAGASNNRPSSHRPAASQASTGTAGPSQHHHVVQHFIETLTGLKIKLPRVSGVVLKERYRSISCIPVSKSQYHVAPEGSMWVVIGVLVSKQISTTTKGAPYSRWRVSDLGGSDASIFVFGEAHKEHYSEAEGSVLAFYNPKSGSKGAGSSSSGGGGLAVFQAAQIELLATSAGWGFCRGVTKAGARCSNAVDTTVSPYCQYHALQQAKTLKKPVRNSSSKQVAQETIPHQPAASSGKVFDARSKTWHSSEPCTKPLMSTMTETVRGSQHTPSRCASALDPGAGVRSSGTQPTNTASSKHLARPGGNSNSGNIPGQGSMQGGATPGSLRPPAAAAAAHVRETLKAKLKQQQQQLTGATSGHGRAEAGPGALHARQPSKSQGSFNLLAVMSTVAEGATPAGQQQQQKAAVPAQVKQVRQQDHQQDQQQQQTTGQLGRQQTGREGKHQQQQSTRNRGVQRADCQADDPSVSPVYPGSQRDQQAATEGAGLEALMHELFDESDDVADECWATSPTQASRKFNTNDAPQATASVTAPVNAADGLPGCTDQHKDNQAADIQKMQQQQQQSNECSTPAVAREGSSAAEARAATAMARLSAIGPTGYSSGGCSSSSGSSAAAKLHDAKQRMKVRLGLAKAGAAGSGTRGSSRGHSGTASKATTATVSNSKTAAHSRPHVSRIGAVGATAVGRPAPAGVVGQMQQRSNSTAHAGNGAARSAHRAAMPPSAPATAAAVNKPAAPGCSSTGAGPENRGMPPTSGFRAMFGRVLQRTDINKPDAKLLSAVDDAAHASMVSKLLDQYEQKDNLAQQLEAITKLEVTAFECRTCKFLTEKRRANCATHDVVPVRVTKRWWICEACGWRLHTLRELIPSKRCPKCRDPEKLFRPTSAYNGPKPSAGSASAAQNPIACREAMLPRGREHAFSLNSLENSAL